MISQETKDHIDREIEAEAYKWDAYYQNEDSFIMPARLFRFGKHVHNQMLTKYAEKLEEKDKEIDNLKTELYSNAKTALDNLQHTRNNFLEELESKDLELAQLKEIAEKMNILLNAIFTTTITELTYDQANKVSSMVLSIRTTYAEWCKQNLK